MAAAKAKNKKVTPKKKVSATSTQKKLTKSKSDKMVAGVIGGVSEYLQVDSTVLRLISVAVMAFTGFIPGIVAYGLAVLVMPEK